MPQISKYGKGLKIRWGESDFLAGLGRQYLNTVFTPWNKSTIKRSNFVDPFRFYGQLSTGYMPTDAVNMSTMTGLGLNAAVRNTGGSNVFSYIVTHTAQLNRLELASGGLSGTITNSGGVFPYNITAHGGHNSVKGKDTLIYKHRLAGVNTTSLFYSWSDNTDGDVGTYNLNATFDDDFMSTVPAGAAVLSTTQFHPMIIGDDDVLYIGDGNKVMAYDGDFGGTSTNGTFYTALVLPSSMVITSFAKTQNFLAVFAYMSEGIDVGASTYYRGTAKSYFWNYLDLDPSYIYDLDDNFVSAAFTHGNRIGCFTAGRSAEPEVGRTNKLRFFDGNKFVAVRSFDGSPPVPGGIETYQGMLMWNAGTYIYSYGTPYSNSNVMYSRFVGSGGSAGLLKEFFSGAIFASSGASSGQMQSFYQNYTTGNITFGGVEPPFDEYHRWRPKWCRIGFAAEFLNGREVTVSTRTNDYSSPLKSIATIPSALNANTNINGGTIQSFDRYADGTDFEPFSRIDLNFSFDTGLGATNGPIISFFEMYIEPVN